MQHAWYRKFTVDGSDRLTSNPTSQVETWTGGGWYVEAVPVICGNCGTQAYLRSWYELTAHVGFRDDMTHVGVAEGVNAVKDCYELKMDIVNSEGDQTSPPPCA